MVQGDGDVHGGDSHHDRKRRDGSEEQLIVEGSEADAAERQPKRGWVERDHAQRGEERCDVRWHRYFEDVIQPHEDLVEREELLHLLAQAEGVIILEREEVQPPQPRVRRALGGLVAPDQQDADQQQCRGDKPREERGS